MNVKLRRLLMPLLRHDAAGKPPTFRTRSAARQAIYLIEKPVSLKKVQGRLRREQQRTSARASRNQETKAIREKVFGRAGDACEGCHTGFIHWGATMDHWSSGSGKSQRQTVENCWVLCGAPSIPGSCHYLRQRNLPSVGIWNNRFAAHAAKYGYPVIAHIEHADPAKAGGAP